MGLTSSSAYHHDPVCNALPRTGIRNIAGTSVQDTSDSIYTVEGACGGQAEIKGSSLWVQSRIREINSHPIEAKESKESDCLELYSWKRRNSSGMTNSTSHTSKEIEPLRSVYASKTSAGRESEPHFGKRSNLYGMTYHTLKETASPHYAYASKAIDSKETEPNSGKRSDSSSITHYTSQTSEETVSPRFKPAQPQTASIPVSSENSTTKGELLRIIDIPMLICL